MYTIFINVYDEIITVLVLNIQVNQRINTVYTKIHALVLFAPLLPTLSLGKNSNVSNHLSLNIKVCLCNFKIGQTVCM